MNSDFNGCRRVRGLCWKLRCFGGAVLGLALTANGWSHEINEGVEAADRLVNEAQLLGIVGEVEQRDLKLQTALNLFPEFPKSHWALGQTQIQDRWSDLNGAAIALSQDPTLVRYRAQRAKTPLTAEAQWELAQWCHKNRLPAQCKAHLNLVLQLDPTNVPAMQALGYQQINGRWISPETMAAAIQQATEDLADYLKSESSIRSVIEGLASRSPAARELALQKLQALTDPSVIVGIEELLTEIDEPTARLAITSLQRFPERRATEALARQTLLSPWPSVRLQAAEALRDRDLLSFVPGLLSEFQMPLSSATQLVRLSPNRLIYREVLVGENAGQIFSQIKDTTVRRFAIQGVSARDASLQAANDIFGSQLQHRASVEFANLEINARNALVCEVLRISTGENLEADPRTWWAWWNETNGLLTGPKPSNFSYVQQTWNYADTPPQTSDDQDDAESGSTPGNSSGSPQSDPGEVMSFSPRNRWMATFDMASFDCLAAGTPVLTDQGEIPIEQVQIGDLVASQNILTGAISFEPVIRTTVRPAAPITELRLNNEWIQASGGHPFWVAGEGWRMAKEIEVGMRLHTADGPVQVIESRIGDQAQTYNLVVENNGTYFAGHQRVLGHDGRVRLGKTMHALPGIEF